MLGSQLHSDSSFRDCQEKDDRIMIALSFLNSLSLSLTLSLSHLDDHGHDHLFSRLFLFVREALTCPEDQSAWALANIILPWFTQNEFVVKHWLPWLLVCLLWLLWLGV